MNDVCLFNRCEKERLVWLANSVGCVVHNNQKHVLHSSLNGEGVKHVLNAPINGGGVGIENGAKKIKKGVKRVFEADNEVVLFIRSCKDVGPQNQDTLI
jgi:hypothetical protein